MTLGEEDAPSCSALEALERQEPFVNQTLASFALGLLARLFRHRELEVHGAFVNVAQQKSQAISVDPALWKRMRKRGTRRSSQ